MNNNLNLYVGAPAFSLAKRAHTINPPLPDRPRMWVGFKTWDANASFAKPYVWPSTANALPTS